MGDIFLKKSFYQQEAGAHVFDVTLKESNTRLRRQGGIDRTLALCVCVCSAGHFLGNHSVLEILRQEGYEIVHIPPDHREPVRE